ncbi:hypothetical protein [Delftia tsuruhatensis]|uniref:hypothetical protein n=1 Tax=Delftia tsuruhatensis TaxID=180282 RepID=UPI001F4442D9|nr:hypothetical protein [Delftia tsuruhatensis]
MGQPNGTASRAREYGRMPAAGGGPTGFAAGGQGRRAAGRVRPGRFFLQLHPHHPGPVGALYLPAARGRLQQQQGAAALVQRLGARLDGRLRRMGGLRHLPARQQLPRACTTSAAPGCAGRP